MSEASSSPPGLGEGDVSVPVFLFFLGFLFILWPAPVFLLVLSLLRLWLRLRRSLSFETGRRLDRTVLPLHGAFQQPCYRRIRSG